MYTAWNVISTSPLKQRGSVPSQGAEQQCSCLLSEVTQFLVFSVWTISACMVPFSIFRQCSCSFHSLMHFEHTHKSDFSLMSLTIFVQFIKKPLSSVLLALSPGKYLGTTGEYMNAQINSIDYLLWTQGYGKDILYLISVAIEKDKDTCFFVQNSWTFIHIAHIYTIIRRHCVWISLVSESLKLCSFFGNG